MPQFPQRLAAIHTVALLVDTFKPMLVSAYPDLDIFHVLDESLLQDLVRKGESPDLVLRVAMHAMMAEKAGASVILFTCSSTSPAVDTARRLISIPIVKIDDAMAELAATSGRRIGILCTTPSTVAPSSDLVRSHALRLHKDVEVKVLLKQNAYEALIRSDRKEHDRIIIKAASEIASTSDVIVLAQASLAHLADQISATTDIPVLASPQSGVGSLAHYLQ